MIVYGKAAGCPDCNKAKTLLKSKGIEFQYVDLESNMEKFFEFMQKGIRQVPVIDLNGELIVGFSALTKHLEVG